jgi:hypothetical protein
MDTPQPALSTVVQKERLNQWNQISSCREAHAANLKKSTLFGQGTTCRKEEKSERRTTERG